MKDLSLEQLTLLERLCNACAVSGDEGEVRRIVLEEIKPYVDEARVDALGNVLAVKRGAGTNPLRVMLDAHMDEVGFMLVAEEGDGVYRFETVGSLDTACLPGKLVLVGREHTPGVISVRPVHLMKENDLKQAILAESLRIDLGPGGKARPGDWATFATRFRRAGDSLFAKAIDDRIGVATLISLLKSTPPHIELLAAFSVQEEIGLRGARTAAYAFEPHLAIALDATPARDLPLADGAENTAYNTQLGRGPAIYVHNRSTLDDPRLVRFLRETARAAGIPYQTRQPGGGSTDAGAIQRTRAGVPVVSVSVPHRYTHSPISVARVDDWQNTLRLLRTALENMPPDLIQ